MAPAQDCVVGGLCDDDVEAELIVVKVEEAFAVTSETNAPTRDKTWTWRESRRFRVKVSYGPHSSDHAIKYLQKESLIM